MLLKRLQSSKASLHISVTISGITMSVNALQPWKSLSFISLTESGMTILVKLEQWEKALKPIFCTELGMTVAEQPAISSLHAVSMMALQFSRESYTLLFSSTEIFVSAEQPDFEVGGRKKSFEQIADVPNSFLAVDDTEVGHGNRIPLWLFGVTY